MDLGFKWFATDEGVLGRTQNIGFWRDAGGFPENGAQLYTPWRLKRGTKEMSGFFRDHYLSDLVGFVYSRMGAPAAAEDLHRRIRAIGDRAAAGADRHGEPDPRRRKRLGILSRQRARVPAAVFIAAVARIPKFAR